MSDVPPGGERLDSWKAIAEYLQRDVATVRRWEKSLGLPVRRVAGTGRSVFAYTSEINHWLQTAKPILPAVDASLSPATPVLLTRANSWRWLGIGGVVVAVAVAAFFLARSARVTGERLHVEVTGAGVVARDTAGVELWRHQFPPAYKTSVIPEAIQATHGTGRGVYFATNYRGRSTEDSMESGVLTLLDDQGRPQRSFSFADEVTFGGRSYGPPWMLTAFAVAAPEGPVRIAVTAHHYTWDPGLVTILDDQWQRRGTFVHAGWIEGVRWFGSDRLLVAGFSNAHDGGMVALLDATALDGQGPEPSGSRHFCETCGPGRPLRTFVFPRTEVNRASASRFNRASLRTSANGQVFVHTVEMTSASAAAGDADAVYEFSPTLDLVSARFSDRYWEMHTALEAKGTIKHSREQCPDRQGPRELQMWEATTGWRHLKIR